MPLTGYYAVTPVELTPDEFSTVPSFWIINYGRTTAVVEGIKVGWDFNLKLPRAPDYKSFINYGPTAAFECELPRVCRP